MTHCVPPAPAHRSPSSDPGAASQPNPHLALHPSSGPLHASPSSGPLHASPSSGPLHATPMPPSYPLSSPMHLPSSLERSERTSLPGNGRPQPQHSLYHATSVAGSAAMTPAHPGGPPHTLSRSTWHGGQVEPALAQHALQQGRGEVMLAPGRAAGHTHTPKPMGGLWPHLAAAGSGSASAGHPPIVPPGLPRSLASTQQPHAASGSSSGILLLPMFGSSGGAGGFGFQVRRSRSLNGDEAIPGLQQQQWPAGPYMPCLPETAPVTRVGRSSSQNIIQRHEGGPPTAASSPSPPPWPGSASEACSSPPSSSRQELAAPPLGSSSGALLLPPVANYPSTVALQQGQVRSGAGVWGGSSSVGGAGSVTPSSGGSGAGGIQQYLHTAPLHPSGAYAYPAPLPPLPQFQGAHASHVARMGMGLSNGRHGGSGYSVHQPPAGGGGPPGALAADVLQREAGGAGGKEGGAPQLRGDEGGPASEPGGRRDFGGAAVGVGAGGGGGGTSGQPLAPTSHSQPLPLLAPPSHSQPLPLLAPLSALTPARPHHADAAVAGLLAKPSRGSVVPPTRAHAEGAAAGAHQGVGRVVEQYVIPSRRPLHEAAEGLLLPTHSALAGRHSLC